MKKKQLMRRLTIVGLFAVLLILTGCRGSDGPQTGWIMLPQGTEVLFTNFNHAGVMPNPACSFAQEAEVEVEGKDQKMIGLVDTSINTIDSYVRYFATTWYENRIDCEAALAAVVQQQAAIQPPQQSDTGSQSAQNLQVQTPEQPKLPLVEAQALPLPPTGYQTMKQRVATILEFSIIDTIFYIAFLTFLFIAAPLENAVEKKRKSTTLAYIAMCALVILVSLAHGAAKDGTLVPFCNNFGSTVEGICDAVDVRMDVIQLFVVIIAYVVMYFSSNTQRDVVGDMQHEERFPTEKARQQWVDDDMLEKDYDDPVYSTNDGDDKNPYVVHVNKMEEKARKDRTYMLGLTAVLMVMLIITGVFTFFKIGETGFNRWNWVVGGVAVALWIFSLGEVRKEYGGDTLSLLFTLGMNILVLAAFNTFFEQVLPFAKALAIFMYPLANTQLRGKGSWGIGIFDIAFFNVVTWVLLNLGVIDFYLQILAQIQQYTGG